MNGGVTFDFRPRKIGDRVRLHVCPPFAASGQMVVGSYTEPGFSRPVVAFMHDYYSVGAEEQRRMAENTIALCELLYEQQQLSSTN